MDELSEIKSATHPKSGWNSNKCQEDKIGQFVSSHFYSDPPLFLFNATVLCLQRVNSIIIALSAILKICDYHRNYCGGGQGGDEEDL